MKKYILTLALLATTLITLKGQNDVGFSSVPVINGKVVFEQFIISDPSLTSSQNYIKLQKWVKEKYYGSPLLSGIRFDDKANSVTVSAKTNLSDGVSMNYRFDASITSAGCLLVIRDVTYQDKQRDADSFFPKINTAEQTITDQAVNSGDSERDYRDNLRKATLLYINKLYAELNKQFDF